MLVRETISFQRYKDPKTALGLGKGAAIKIISIESRFADVFVSEKEKDEILSDPIANKEKIKKKQIYLDIRNGGGLFKVQDFAGELVSYNEKLYLMPDSLSELGEIFNLVRESLGFERYKDPKVALGLISFESIKQYIVDYFKNNKIKEPNNTDEDGATYMLFFPIVKGYSIEINVVRPMHYYHEPQTRWYEGADWSEYGEGELSEVNVYYYNTDDIDEKLTELVNEKENFNEIDKIIRDKFPSER